jgi:hypothetical protein
MTKAQRKRRAVIGAIALLEWRDRMAQEDARDRRAKEIADRETALRFETMVAEMRRQVEEFGKPRPAKPPRLVVVREGPPTSRASHSS